MTSSVTDTELTPAGIVSGSVARRISPRYSPSCSEVASNFHQELPSQNIDRTSHSTGPGTSNARSGADAQVRTLESPEAGLGSGDGIPELEREVLQDGMETPLHHGQALGLQLTYWCLTSSHP